MRKVSLKELHEWLKKNKHVTWQPEAFDAGNADKPGRLKAKYLDIQLDTRDMGIFRITLRSFGKSIVVDFRDSEEGSLLDGLDRVLTEDEK